MKTAVHRLAAAAALTVLALPLQAAPVSFVDAAGNAAGIQSTVDSFRAALGGLNPNVIGSFGSGRREINWDGVPTGFAAPNNLPANFFNANSPRGVEFSTPGTGFAVSANAGVAPVEFGNINPAYPGLFAPFSPQRLFTALGSNIVDVRFFVPGSATAALTQGFGVVFTDVDLINTTSIEYFDAADLSLGSFFAPAASGDETLSFLGVLFTQGRVVSRVRITSGNEALSAASPSGDVVAMDDFIYGEPVTLGAALPEPGSLLLSAAALLALRFARRRA